MPGDDDQDPTCPCRKEIPGSLWMECAECETTWHPICCGLDGLTQMPINKLLAKKWKCPRCFKLAEDIQPAQTMKTQLSEETVSEIIAVVNSTVEENLKTLLSQENLNQDAEDSESNEDPYRPVNRRRRNRRRHESIQEAIQEQREEEVLIDKKKDNLIIYGMPESETENKKEEMLEDYRRIEKVYSGKVELQKEDIVHMTRIGTKDEEKTRPIQITLANQTKRKELLTKNMNLKLLEDDLSTPIYVSPDRTRKQREADKILREELKRRKVTNPNLVIRNNQIVPFRQRAQNSESTWASVLS